MIKAFQMKIFTIFLLFTASAFSQISISGLSGGYDINLVSTSPFDKFVSTWNYENSGSIVTSMSPPGTLPGFGLNVFYDDGMFLTYSFGYSQNKGRMTGTLDPLLSTDKSAGLDIDLTLHNFTSGFSLPIVTGEAASVIIMPSVEFGYGWIDHEMKVKGLNRTFENYTGTMYSFAGGLTLFIEVLAPLYLYGKASYTTTFITSGFSTLYDDAGLKTGYRHFQRYDTGGTLTAIKLQLGITFLLFDY